MALPGLLLERQKGRLSPSGLHAALSGNAALLQRLQLQQPLLQGHTGCVNTVHFSPDGTLLVSGSDDQDIRFWDFQEGRTLLRWASGHHNNVFQARVMPESHNKTVISCAADGQVRVAQLADGGGQVETRRLARHQGRAHKLAIEPGSPYCFYSCGEDGEVRHFDLREPAAGHRRLLVCRASAGRPLELNSIHCNPRQPCQFVVGGADEECRVYDQRKPSRSSASLLTVAQPVRRLAPQHLRRASSRDTFTTTHVTCAVFSQQGEILATYNDENIYLFATEGSWRQRDGARGASASAGAGGSAHSARRRAGQGGGDDRAAAATGTSGRGKEEGGQRAQRGEGEGSRGSNKRGRGSSSGEDEGHSARRRGGARGRAATVGGGMGSEAGPSASDAGAAARRAALLPPRGASGEAEDAGAAAAAAHAHMRAGLLREAQEDVSTLSLSSPARTAAAPMPYPAASQQPAEPSGSCGPQPAGPELDAMIGPMPRPALEQGVGEGQQAGGHSSDSAWLARQVAPVGAAAAEAAATDPGRTPYRDPRLAEEGGGRQMDEEGEVAVGPPAPSGSEGEAEEGAEGASGGAVDWRSQLLEAALAGSSGTPSWDRGSQSSEDEEAGDSGNEADESASEEDESGSEEDESEEEAEEEEEESGSEGGASPQVGALGENEEDEAEAEALMGGPSFGSLEEEASDEVAMCYRGHRNSQTVKGVNFFGARDEWVVSGSDCGHVFVWDKARGQLRVMVKGDRHVVNCLEPHPHRTLTLATSGIEDDIKIWAPTAPEAVPLGSEAEEVMRANERSQGRAHRRMVITPQLLRLLLGGRVEVRRRARGGGGGEAAAAAADVGEEGAQGTGSEEASEGEGDDSDREWLLHAEGSEDEAGAEQLRRIAPGECSIS